MFNRLILSIGVVAFFLAPIEAPAQSSKARIQSALDMFESVCLDQLPDFQQSISVAKGNFGLPVSLKEEGYTYLGNGPKLPSVSVKPGTSCQISLSFTPTKKSTVKKFLRLLKKFNIKIDKELDFGAPGEKVHFVTRKGTRGNQSVGISLRSSSYLPSLDLQVVLVDE